MLFDLAERSSAERTRRRLCRNALMSFAMSEAPNLCTVSRHPTGEFHLAGTWLQCFSVIGTVVVVMCLSVSRLLSVRAASCSHDWHARCVLMSVLVERFMIFLPFYDLQNVSFCWCWSRVRALRVHLCFHHRCCTRLEIPGDETQRARGPEDFGHAFHSDAAGALRWGLLLLLARRDEGLCLEFVNSGLTETILVCLLERYPVRLDVAAAELHRLQFLSPRAQRVVQEVLGDVTVPELLDQRVVKWSPFLSVLGGPAARSIGHSTQPVRLNDSFSVSVPLWLLCTCAHCPAVAACLPSSTLWVYRLSPVGLLL